MSCPTGNCGDGKFQDLLTRMQKKNTKKKKEKFSIFSVVFFGYTAYLSYYAASLIEDQFLSINLYIFTGFLTFALIKRLIKL